MSARDGSNAHRMYVLIVILVANILNYADRTVLSILAEPIKKDLGISDGQMGFLYGTSFVLFLGLLAMAAAHLADVWLRHRLLAVGIAVWSSMTALSGFATNYVQLAAARFGVGLGESTISPVGHSMLADIFPAHRRGLVFSIYLSGPFLGSGLCIAVGGWILGAWPDACGGWDLCHIKGWQAAFFVFGLPGLIVALLALRMGEPVEPEKRKQTKPVREGLRELTMLLPPFTFWRLAQFGGKRAVTINISAVATIIAIVAALVHVTGDRAQWISVGVVAYAAVSWVQTLAYRDKALFHLTVSSPAFRAAAAGGSLIGILSASFGFWTIPFAIRSFGLAPHEASAALAVSTAGGSFIGTVLGGILADFGRRRSPAAPLWIAAIAVVSAAVTLEVLLTMTSLTSYAVTLAVLMFMCGLWTAPMASLVQDLILPGVRARAGVMFSLTLTLMALLLGPYTVGRVADYTGSLAKGLNVLVFLAPISLLLLAYAARKIPAALAERAKLEAEQARAVTS